MWLAFFFWQTHGPKSGSSPCWIPSTARFTAWSFSQGEPHIRKDLSEGGEDEFLGKFVEGVAVHLTTGWSISSQTWTTFLMHENLGYVVNVVYLQKWQLRYFQQVATKRMLSVSRFQSPVVMIHEHGIPWDWWLGHVGIDPRCCSWPYLGSAEEELKDVFNTVRAVCLLKNSHVLWMFVRSSWILYWCILMHIGFVSVCRVG